MTATAATPAERKLAGLWVEPEHLAASLTDSKAAMLSWAGRDGRYSIEDLEAILKGHGETLSAWVDDCHARCSFRYWVAVYDAEALLTWLGY
jgi:hypothetical protein